MAKKLNDGHYHELLDRLYVVASVVEEHCKKHPVTAKERHIAKILEEATVQLAEAYQEVGKLMVNKKAKKTPRKTEFVKMQEKVIDGFATIKYIHGDVSDIGNEVGYALRKELSNRQSLTDFLHGLHHGIALIEHDKKKTK